MIHVIFKNLESSPLARESTLERFAVILDKFPDLEKSRIKITLEMKNSPIQAGPDLFSVKAQISGGKYRNIRVEKSAQSLYIALADVIDHMLELLNRCGDRNRVKARKNARRFNFNVNLRLNET